MSVTGFRLHVNEKLYVMKSYRDLEIYNMAYQLAIKVHRMTLTLPKYEMYEQGSQVRRSTKSIKDNIVEGYGRNRYKNEFIKFLVYAHASSDEATSQLTMIDEIHFESKGLTELIEDYEVLGRKINKFIDYVEKHWNENNYRITSYNVCYTKLLRCLPGRIAHFKTGIKERSG